MTPKDTGILRELLHEYGPRILIQMLAKDGYGEAAGTHLRRLAQELDPDTVTLGTNWPSRGMITWADSVTRWAGE